MLDDGPWSHRFVSANGARFHVVEADPVHPGAAGERPLVLLLHGFPQFWWAWRHQLRGLAAAGYRVAAMDLRGFGASDKPPRGYDTPNLCADVAGVIRSLGASEAVLVGQDWGAWLAWSMPALQPRTTRALAVVSMAHPLRLREALLDPRQLWAVRDVLAFQTPWQPERRLVAEGVVADLLQRWSAPGWPDAETAARYAEAMRLPFVAHSSLEYFRWAVRSTVRQDGWRFAAAVRATVTVPVLQIHGAQDPYVPAAAARGSSKFVRGSYQWELLEQAGHFPAEEAPEATTALLIDWLSSALSKPGADPSDM